MVPRLSLQQSGQRPKSVAVIGAGGVIGSHLVPHLASMGWERVILVDGDVYDEKNLKSQAILPRDVGRPKATVQARRLRTKAPGLTVKVINARVEDVSLGHVRADVILSCVDSRVARQTINQAAWRLAVPLVDSAVDATGMLARVNVYVPGPATAPCLECAWSEEDYLALEQEYPCPSGQLGVAPTNAPSALGAIGAAMAAVETQKLVDGDWDHLLESSQQLIDLRNGGHSVTRFNRNPDCRFDHQLWQVEPVHTPPSRLTVATILRLAGADPSHAEVTVELEGSGFVRTLVCPQCGAAAPNRLQLVRPNSSLQCPCPQCSQRVDIRGFDVVEQLEAAKLTKKELQRSLRSLGLRAGDIVTVSGPDGQRHFEIGVSGPTHTDSGPPDSDLKAGSQHAPSETGSDSIQNTNTGS